MERKDANETFYRRPVTAAELLGGVVPPPPQADILYRALNAKTSSHGSSHLSSHVSSHGSSHVSSHANNFEHDKDSNHHPTGINHSVTTSYSKGTDNFDSNADANDDPAPAYTPSAVPNIQETAITNSGHGRSSSDNPSLGSYSSTDTRPRAPPPPPPPVSTKPDIVTALYDFSGEQATDLSFKKGDIITVIKKTPSKNDWWTGRCNGSEGSFPANYTI
ncbi:hypothetical protein BGZ80_011103 [Entomortierella chlamydospora]|uniref:SH3 domain-containing protein n=1 Tax=Entomortierella chlamydospora TaxID=101097 RepID=A0A9P6SZD8_9FUNG|nr:hypothetical protein BGZ80_011103 [Entomortierella chlamydospora]